MKKSNQPNHEIRLGTVRATIWSNQGEDGETWYRVTMSRLYRENSKWSNTQSFRPADLPALGKAIDLAHDWLLGREAIGASSKRNEKTRSGKGRSALNGESDAKQGRKGKSQQAGGERALMRKSKGSQRGLTGGRKRGSDSPSLPRRDGSA